MMETYRFVVKHKRIFTVIAVILSIFFIYQLGIRFGDLIFRISH